MKKTLALLLAFFILTNFHCARFQLQTTGPEKVPTSFKASLMEDSGDFLVETKGTIILKEDSLIFKSKEETKEILYSQISSIDVQGNTKRAIQRIPSYNFTTKQNKDNRLILWFLTIMILVTLFFGIWLLFSSSPAMDIHFDTDSGLDTATFKITKGEMAKIYPLLLEKIY